MKSQHQSTPFHHLHIIPLLLYGTYVRSTVQLQYHISPGWGYITSVQRWDSSIRKANPCRVCIQSQCAFCWTMALT